MNEKAPIFAPPTKKRDSSLSDAKMVKGIKSRDFRVWID